MPSPAGASSFFLGFKIKCVRVAQHHFLLHVLSPFLPFLSRFFISLPSPFPLLSVVVVIVVRVCPRCCIICCCCLSFFADDFLCSFGGSGAGSRREQAALQRAMELAMGVAPKGGDVNHRRVTATTVTDEVRVGHFSPSIVRVASSSHYKKCAIVFFCARFFSSFFFSFFFP